MNSFMAELPRVREHTVQTEDDFVQGADRSLPPEAPAETRSGQNQPAFAGKVFR